MWASKDENDWRGAAVDACGLSELYLTLGEVERAVEYGRRSVEYADKSGDKIERLQDLTGLADAFHQAGETEKAKRLFVEAEGIQKEDQPGDLYLYSLQGYQYCDLLLTLGEYEEVKRRAKWSIEIAERNTWLLSIALDKLSLGRAGLESAFAKASADAARSAEEDLIEAKRWLDEAVDGLRTAGTQHHIPQGLLARAEYYRYRQSWDKARGDLEEVREIAERGEMKLWMADYHLESARVCLDEGTGSPTEEPREHSPRLRRSRAGSRGQGRGGIWKRRGR